MVDPKHVENDNVLPNRVENVPLFIFTVEVFRVDVFIVLVNSVEPKHVENDNVLPNKVENVPSFIFAVEVFRVDVFIVLL